MSKKEFANTMLFFLIAIKDRLNIKGWNRNESNNNEFALIKSDNISYSWNIIKLIEKSLSDNKWKCKLNKYYLNDNTYNYLWMMEKRA